MNRIALILTFFTILFCGGVSLGVEGQDSFADKVVIIPVGEDSLSSKQSFSFMNRILQRAQDENAKAIVFELNTPGGLAWETSEMMMRTIHPMSIPTYAFVNSKAMSAGALISAACDKIYMAPVSSIGAAGIVTDTGEEMDPIMRKKAESAFSSFARSVANDKGYREQVIQAMIIPAEKDETFGPVRLAKGELLTLTGKEATTILPDGKPLLAQGTATSVQDLLTQENIQAPVVTATPTFFEQIALWIAWISPLLILLGIGGIYLEIKTPGFGVGGIVAIIAFGLFFFGNNIAGNLAGYETAALLVFGVILICVEIFVFPGSFVPAIIGSICVLIALFFGMINGNDIHFIFTADHWQDFGLIWDIAAVALFKLILGLGGAACFIALLMKYLPNSVLMRNVNNAAIAGGTTGEAVQLADVQIGDYGHAVTELKPNGKALINGQTCEVFSQQGILPKGTAVQVVGVRAFDLVVIKYKQQENV